MSRVLQACTYRTTVSTLGTRSVALWPRGKGPRKAWTFAATAEVAIQAASAEDPNESGASVTPGVVLQQCTTDSYRNTTYAEEDNNAENNLATRLPPST